MEETTGQKYNGPLLHRAVIIIAPYAYIDHGTLAAWQMPRIRRLLVPATDFRPRRRVYNEGRNELHIRRVCCIIDGRIY